ncbi:chlorohydrolase [Streptococcus pneumoniae]|nr:chlorohydrolase [Streptococcus pneumoniae]
MKIKEQTRKLAAGSQNTAVEVVDRTDEVSNQMKLTKSVTIPTARQS